MTSPIHMVCIIEGRGTFGYSGPLSVRRPPERTGFLENKKTPASYR